jgi:hypothetical protein
LEEHYPQVFLEEKIRAGYYRDKDGKLWVLYRDNDDDWVLTTIKGPQLSPSLYDFFETSEADHLRKILSQMVRVENP